MKKLLNAVNKLSKEILRRTKVENTSISLELQLFTNGDSQIKLYLYKWKNELGKQEIEDYKFLCFNGENINELIKEIQEWK